MSKKVSDLFKNLRSIINLKISKNNSYKAPKILPFINKKSPVIPFTDLSGSKTNYLYYSGKKFRPPAYLGNIIRTAVFGILIILVINMLNVYYKAKSIEKELSTSAEQAYSTILDGGKNLGRVNFNEALTAFARAQTNFAVAKEQLWFSTNSSPIYRDQGLLTESANILLKSGEYFTKSAAHMVKALELISRIPVDFIRGNQKKYPEYGITNVVKQALEEIDKSALYIAEADKLLIKLDINNLPGNIRGRVLLAKKYLGTVTENLNAASKHFPAILNLLGEKYPHRFLVLLQNNNEIRPSGGFIGSYAIIDINDGIIEKFEIHDSYDIDGSFGGTIEPPDFLTSVIDNWRFRDSNYSPDFPTSAKNARWMLQKQGGPTVDTVIAINQGLLRDLMEITGPIQVGNFGQLTSANYTLLLSFIIESKIWGPEDPKHILKVFAPAFKDKILNEKNIGKISNKILRAVEQEHIMAYSTHPEIQGLFSDYGLDGKIQTKKNQDYLSVINYSIGGTKSDQFIEEKINHYTNLTENGTIINELEITRKHLWNDSIYTDWKKTLNSYGIMEIPDQVIDILGRGRNETLMRIYVPKGSEIITSNQQNLETGYDKDLDLSYFLTRMEIRAGEQKKVDIKYKVPFVLRTDIGDTYTLIVDKQPGSRGSIFTKQITYDENLQPLSYFPQNTEIVNENNLSYSTTLTFDAYWAGIFKKD